VRTYGRKAINLADDDGWQALPLTNIPSELRRNRALAGYGRTHMFVMSWIYELPFDKGRQFGMNGCAEGVGRMADRWHLLGLEWQSLHHLDKHYVSESSRVEPDC
jgi:hypothetical protein